jgi:hypothetical protein
MACSGAVAVAAAVRGGKVEGPALPLAVLLLTSGKAVDLLAAAGIVRVVFLVLFGFGGAWSFRSFEFGTKCL